MASSRSGPSGLSGKPHCFDCRRFSTVLGKRSFQWAQNGEGVKYITNSAGQAFWKYCYRCHAERFKNTEDQRIIQYKRPLLQNVSGSVSEEETVGTSAEMLSEHDASIQGSLRSCFRGGRQKTRIASVTWAEQLEDVELTQYNWKTWKRLGTRSFSKLFEMEPGVFCCCDKCGVTARTETGAFRPAVPKSTRCVWYCFTCGNEVDEPQRDS